MASSPVESAARAGPFHVYVNDDIRTSGAAVIFGWVGSTPRLLKRYASLYLSACNLKAVYTVTADTVSVFMRPRRLRDLMRAALGLLEERHPLEPCVLSYFSNGGSFIHEQLLEMIKEERRLSPSSPSSPLLSAYPRVRLAATVFDSCPAHLTIRSGSMAVSEGQRNPVVRALAFAAMAALLVVLIPFVIGINRPESYLSALAADPLPCPTLYIFSTGDRITELPRIAELIVRRGGRTRAAIDAEARAKRMGRKTDVAHPLGEGGVRELVLGDRAGHVAHLLAEPDKYRDAVVAVVEQGRKALAAAGSSQARL